MQSPSHPLPDPMRGWRWVHEATSLSRTTVWRLVRAGRFPAPVRISPGRVAWQESAVTAWLEARRERSSDV